MQIKINLYKNNIADGQYDIKDKGCIAACLSWANAEGELKEYSPFAYLPLNPDGSGRFLFTGGRGIPEEAEGVCVKTVTSDFSEVREGYWKLPETHRIYASNCSAAPRLRIGLISDLHMTNKPGRTYAVLNRLKDMDVVLMAGDLVNNCDTSQYERLAGAIEETMPDKPIFAVSGNHDIPEGVTRNYRIFEGWLHGRQLSGQPYGQSVFMDSGAGAFAVMLNSQVDLIGLNPLYNRKIFHFPDKGMQIKWLEQYLKDSPAKQHLIMCHAPLLAHNPQRSVGKNPPYLARDASLQNIIDSKGNIIFLSGHTHLSPNVPGGCVEYDSERDNIYINDGSVCPVDLKSSEIILPAEWMDGCFTELVLYENSLEIIMKFLCSGKNISRGYYSMPVR